MVKPEEEVIKDFNEVVNMTADELEAFLKTGDSTSTGWTKEGSDESVGHESGRKIVDILQRNPDKEPEKYTEEDIEHMRKVVSYCKRHLAQEEHMKDEKTPEELEKTKSTRSLKNWGHDPLKTMEGGTAGNPNDKKPDEKKPASKKADKPASKKGDKPVSKKAESKPVSKKAPAKKQVEKVEEEGGEEDKADEPAEKPAAKQAEKPVSKKAADKPAPKKETAKPVSKKGAAAKKDEEAEVGEKREGEEEKGEKPAAKKTKTEKAEKPKSEGSRKPPSRSAKKA